MARQKSLKQRQEEWDLEYGPNSTKEHRAVPVRPSDIQDALAAVESEKSNKDESIVRKFKGQGITIGEPAPWHPPTMLFDKVLIQEDGVQERTASGLYIPSSAQEKTYIGKVIAVGPGDWESGVFVPVKVSPGYQVMYQQRAGDKVVVDGKDFLCLRHREILMIL